MSRAAKSGPPPDPAPSPPPVRPSRWWSWLALLVTLAFLVLMFWPSLWSIQMSSLSYTDFVSKVDGNQVVSVTIDDHGSVRGTLRDGSAFDSRIPAALDTSGLEGKLTSKNVQVTAEQSGSVWGDLLSLFLPVLLLIALFVWMGRRAKGAVASGVTGFGRSRARIIEAERPTTRSWTSPGATG